MGHSSERADSFSQQTMLFCTFPQKTTRERDLTLNYPHEACSSTGVLNSWAAWTRAYGVGRQRPLKFGSEMRLSGSSFILIATSGMAALRDGLTN